MPPILTRLTKVYTYRISVRIQCKGGIPQISQPLNPAARHQIKQSLQESINDDLIAASTSSFRNRTVDLQLEETCAAIAQDIAGKVGWQRRLERAEAARPVCLALQS